MMPGHLSAIWRRRKTPAACAVLLTGAVLSVIPATAAAIGNPVIVGQISDQVSLSGATSVAISGHYAYTTASNDGRLAAINISDPAHLAIAGESAQDNDLYNGSTVSVSNGYAFVVSRNRNLNQAANDDGTGNSLTILDIHTNPAQPAIVGAVRDSSKLFDAYGVAVSGNHAYVASQGLIKGQPSAPDLSEGAFSVIDLTAPASPAIVGHLDNLALPAPWTETDVIQHLTSVAISGHYAFVTSFYQQRLTVIDIATPGNPTIVASLKDSVNLAVPTDVTIRGNYAYVANQTSNPGHANVTVVDIGNPLNPHVVGTVAGPPLSNASRIRLHGNFAFVSAAGVNSITAVDISNPGAPRVAGSVTSGGDLNRTTGLDVDPSGRYVVASSPQLASETRPPYPPFPLQPAGPANTGTISMIALSPNPLAIQFRQTGAPANPTSSTVADLTFRATDAVSNSPVQARRRPVAAVRCGHGALQPAQDRQACVHGEGDGRFRSHRNR